MIELEDTRVYQTARHIVITGDPAADSEHNCDAMGCGMEHVLYRFPLPVQDEEKERIVCPQP